MTGRLLHDFFRDNVSRYADRPALRLADRVVSYRELDHQSSVVAGALIAKGAGPEVPVAVLLRRSIDTIVIALAVLKSGSFLVPLERRDPRRRIALILEDTRPPLVLAHRDLADLVAGFEGELLAFDHATDLGGATPLASAKLSEQNLAYVIYTSGSTGRPKGVAMSHRGVSGIIDHTVKTSRADGSWRTLQFASLGFDIFFQECFSTWITGGALELVDEASREDPNELAATTARSRAQRIFLPYVGLRQLAEAIAVANLNLPELREVYSAGEQLVITPEIRALFERHPHCTLFNHYGPTEAHVVSALELVGPPAKWPARPPIGHPIPGVALHVVGTDGGLVSDGQDGEIYVGGASLARGYLNRPDITAERFVEDRFSGAAGGRLYKTGDIGRRLADGSIQFLGRADHQIKVRGFRVELGEVEAALMQHAAVRQALVVARAGEDSTSARLVAYVCPAANGRPTDEVMSWIREALPDYMQPASLIWMAELPLTAHGKVDLSALPDPSKQTFGREGATPLVGVERELAQIWSELLGVAHVSRDDSFFELGGHSLLAAQLASKASRLFGRKLSIRDIAVTPVLREQATRFAEQPAPAASTGSYAETLFQYVRSLSREEAARQLASWEPEPEDDAIELPFSKGSLIRLAPDARRLLRVLMREHERDQDLSMPVRRRVRPEGRSRASGIQRNLWELTQKFNEMEIVPGRSRWSLVQCFSHEVRGSLDVDVLSRVVVELQQGHEILRSRFLCDAEGVLWQQVAEATPLEVEDLQHLPEEARRPEAHRQYDELYGRFDLARHPPLKVKLLRLGPDHFILILLVHHLAFDAFSYDILGSALERMYDAGVNGNAVTLGQPPYQYADMVERQSELVTRPAGVEHLRFWSEKLAGARPIELPRLAEPSSEDRPIAVVLSEALRRDLAGAAKQLGCAPWLILFHAFARTLGQRFRRDSLVLINAYGGRERAGADQLIGPLFRPVPLVIEGIGKDTEHDAIERLQKLIAETREHTVVSPAPADMAGLTDLNFNYVPIDAMGGGLRLAGIRCEALDWPWNGDHFSKLKAVVSGNRADLECLFTFDPQFFRRADVEALAEQYKADVQTVVSALQDPSRPPVGES
ncbi:MAG: non-ribosomal peptide synthetase module [Myxococcales bacterium]|nr:non-ribosomal peptide synthetase module [Myxococcales bacterium]